MLLNEQNKTCALPTTHSSRGTSQFPLKLSKFKFQLDEAPKKDQALSWAL